MTLKFTHHAVERYIQFHMLDSVNPDPRDVRALLESHADHAIKSPVKTHRGDTQWRIEALGCELVSRHDEGVDVVVTILPPLRFRELTPEQAQILEARVAQAHHEVEGLAADEAHLHEESLAHRLSEDLSRELMVAARARREAMRQPLAEARAMRIDAQREHAMIAGVLRTARHQIHTDKDNANIRRALRVALKALRAGAQDPRVSVYEEWYATVRSALEEIERIDSQLVTNAFIDGTR